MGLSRPHPQPVLLQRGPAQAFEQINHPEVPAPVLRALNTLQQNVRAAVGPSKALPFGNGTMIEGLQLVQGDTDGGSPNVIKHGLGFAWRGYQIHAVQGGFVTAHAKIAQAANLDASQAQIWTQFTAFTGQTVLCDIWVY